MALELSKYLVFAKLRDYYYLQFNVFPSHQTGAPFKMFRTLMQPRKTKNFADIFVGLIISYYYYYFAKNLIKAMRK